MEGGGRGRVFFSICFQTVGTTNKISGRNELLKTFSPSLSLSFCSASHFVPLSSLPKRLEQAPMAD